MIHGVENEGEGKKTGCVTSLQPWQRAQAPTSFQRNMPQSNQRGEKTAPLSLVTASVTHLSLG